MKNSDAFCSTEKIPSRQIRWPKGGIKTKHKYARLNLRTFFYRCHFFGLIDETLYQSHRKWPVPGVCRFYLNVHQLYFELPKKCCTRMTQRWQVVRRKSYYTSHVVSYLYEIQIEIKDLSLMWIQISINSSIIGMKGKVRGERI